MRILVTGSSGRLGSVVLHELRHHHHDPIGVDVKPAPTDAAAPTHVADLTRVADLMPLLAGCDAVCHLGNFPSFDACATQAEGFANNVASTFAVFEACEKAGVRNIVYASSINAYGLFAGGPKPVMSPPEYLPVDEDHPLLPRAGYPLSKASGEWIAEAFLRRDPALQVFSLRLTWIRRESDVVPEARPEPNAENALPLAGSMFTQVPVADAARAVRLCCEARRPGHTPLNIVGARSMWPWSRELIQATYGRVPEFRAAIGPTDALISGARAERILGFRAE